MSQPIKVDLGGGLELYINIFFEMVRLPGSALQVFTVAGTSRFYGPLSKIAEFKFNPHPTVSNPSQPLIL